MFVIVARANCAAGWYNEWPSETEKNYSTCIYFNISDIHTNIYKIHSYSLIVSYITFGKKSIVTYTYIIARDLGIVRATWA